MREHESLISFGIAAIESKIHRYSVIEPNHESFDIDEMVREKFQSTGLTPRKADGVGMVLFLEYAPFLHATLSSMVASGLRDRRLVFYFNYL